MAWPEPAGHTEGEEGIVEPTVENEDVSPGGEFVTAIDKKGRMSGTPGW